MNRLRTKIFVLVFSLLSVFTVGIFAAYNIQLYNQEYRAAQHRLEQTQQMGFGIFGRSPAPYNNIFDERSSFDRDSIGDIRFADSTVYTVLLDDNNKIAAVINHSSNDMSDDEIKDLAVTLISQSFQKNIGNLYFSKYSYSYTENASIVIVDNSAVNKMLQGTLLVSLCILVLLEAIIFFVSKKLSNRIYEPVKESFEKQKQFIADASHELKTPLAVIMASCDALENNPQETKWLLNIKSESERMNKLISDLLELAKSEEMDDRAQFALGNFSKAVEMSCLTFEGVIFEKGLTLDYSIDENIELNMNEYKIKQLLSILLDNAIKHSVKNGEIKLELKSKDKEVTLSVQNEGEGIPKGENEKIFERFYRADESRNRNENRYGLGLAIAKNIAKSHGATISADSADGFTTFKVVFKI